MVTQITIGGNAVLKPRLPDPRLMLPQVRSGKKLHYQDQAICLFVENATVFLGFYLRSIHVYRFCTPLPALPESQ
jgi:hypothetical protein